MNIACTNGHFDVLQFLMEKESKQNLFDSNLLHTASTRGHEHLVKFLLDQGFDINLKDLTGSTPLYHASKTVNFEILKMLLERGADPNIKTSLGEPLINTIYKDQLKFDLFLQYNADTRAKDSKGMTVMHLACQNYCYKAVESMISHGAFHYEVTNNQGKLPIDLVQDVYGSKEDIKKLLK